MRCLPAVPLCLVLVLSGLTGLLSPALAADYDMPTLRGTQSQFIPAFPRYSNWEGFYVGGHVGYGDSHDDFAGATQPLLALQLRNLTFQNETNVAATQILGAGDSGSVGLGGFVGYNWQFDSTVLGFEFNYTHTNFSVVAPDYPIARNTGALSNKLEYNYALTASGSMRTTDVGLLQARAGYIVADRFLPFITWGLAVGRADEAVSVSCSCQELAPNGANPPVYSEDADFSFTVGNNKTAGYLLGYTVGAGLDVALTPNIFARSDYQYVEWSHFYGINSHVQMVHAGLGLKF